jgi:hypothetical protein
VWQSYEDSSKIGKFTVNKPSAEHSSFPRSLNTLRVFIGIQLPSFFVLQEDLQPQAIFWIYSFSSLWCPKLRYLDLQYCSLIDVSYLTMSKFIFHVHGTRFVRKQVLLPQIFSTFTNLRSLKLFECKKLR